jgi:site-specific recombinase XerD
MSDPETLTFDQALSLYTEAVLAGRNMTENTRKFYSRDIGELLAYLRERAFLTSPSQVGTFHLEQYLARLDERGLKGSSRRRKVASIRSFFGFLHERSLIPQNPALKLIPPSREQHQPRVLSEAEYTRLVNVVQYETRNRAIVELLLQTGMRLSEVSRLTLSDISLPQKISKDPGNVGAVVVHGKGRKTRTVTLNWKACRALKAYLDSRKHLDEPRLFLTKLGRGMGPRSIQQMVEKRLAHR